MAINGSDCYANHTQEQSYDEPAIDLSLLENLLPYPKWLKTKDMRSSHNRKKNGCNSEPILIFS